MHGSDAFDGDYGAGSVGTLPKPVRRLLPPRPHSPSTYRDLDQVKGGVLEPLRELPTSRTGADADRWS